MLIHINALIQKGKRININETVMTVNVKIYDLFTLKLISKKKKLKKEKENSISFHL